MQSHYVDTAVIAGTTEQLGDRFEEVHKWIADLKEIPPVRIERRDVKHCALGTQNIPAAAWVDNIESAVAVVDKQGETQSLRELLKLNALCRCLLCACNAEEISEMVVGTFFFGCVERAGFQDPHGREDLIWLVTAITCTILKS